MTRRPRSTADHEPTVPAGRNVPQPPASARLDVHIDELVLHGFAGTDRFAIGDALERALACHFAERGVPAPLGQARSIERLDGGAFAAMPGANPQAMGEGIAARLYQGIADAREQTPRTDRRKRD